MSDFSIPSLIDQLDHPDANYQREIMDSLVILGEENPEQLIANLQVTESSKLPGLIQVIGELGLREAMLPLMRFVYDNVGKLPMQSARGMAMQTLASLATPDDRGRLSKFLLEIYQDQDPFVRGWALATFGLIEDTQASPLLDEGMKDSHPFIRTKAQEGKIALLQAAPLEPEEVTHEDPQTLLEKIRQSSGGQRTYWLGQLKEHPEVFELSTRLVQEGDKGTMIGLQLLLELGNPKASQIAQHHLMIAKTDAEKAICLRLMTLYLQEPASSEQAGTIRSYLSVTDPFVKQAARFAAARSGQPELAKVALLAINKQDLHFSLELAQSIDQACSYSTKMIALVDDIIAKTKQLRPLRVAQGKEEYILIEAHLLSALSHLHDHVRVGRREIQSTALDSLEGAKEQRPILVSALRLLRDAKEQAATSPLEPDARWSTTATMQLAKLLGHPDAKVQTRALDLLYHGAPDGLGALASWIKPLLMQERDDTTTILIPLLERATGKEAIRLLQDLSEAPESEVRDSAKASLRRLQDGPDVKDATFTRSPD